MFRKWRLKIIFTNRVKIFFGALRLGKFEAPLHKYEGTMQVHPTMNSCWCLKFRNKAGRKPPEIPAAFQHQTGFGARPETELPRCVVLPWFMFSNVCVHSSGCSLADWFCFLTCLGRKKATFYAVHNRIGAFSR
jgi:hypothetical protein